MTANRPSLMLMTTFLLASAALFAVAASPMLKIAALVVA